MHPKAKGLSNRELAAKGCPPFVVDKNGVETQIELHHLLQKNQVIWWKYFPLLMMGIKRFCMV